MNEGDNSSTTHITRSVLMDDSLVRGMSLLVGFWLIQV